jgi:hypothetical protein
MEFLLAVALVAAEFAVLVVAYKMGYHAGKHAERQRTKDLFKSDIKKEIAAVSAFSRELQGKDAN